MSGDIIWGRNAVYEALKAGREIDKLMLAKNSHSGSIPQIIAAARERRVIIQEVHSKKLDELCSAVQDNFNHQGIVAFAAVKEYCSIEDILALAKSRGEAPFIMILEGLTDVGNVGAIIRSAECMGVHGVVMGKRRCAPVNSAVFKASSGAAENMLIARVNNLNDALRRLKSAGVFVYAADMDGTSISQTDISGSAAFIIGSEGKGVSRLLKENCDASIRIPMYGRTQSLNASAAAAIIMYEKKRRYTI